MKNSENTQGEDSKNILDVQRKFLNKLFREVQLAKTMLDQKLKREEYRNAYEVYLRQMMIVFGT